MSSERPPSAFGLWEAGRHAQRAGNLDAAREALVRAAGRPELPPDGYQAVLDTLAEVLAQRGEFRAALTVSWYRLAEPAADRSAPSGAHLRSLQPRVPAVDQARTLAIKGHVEDAAQAMTRANRPVAAALLRERATDWARARAAWESIRASVQEDATPRRTPGEALYRAALVRLNIARCADREDQRVVAARARADAVPFLEEAQAAFEEQGRRDRAFDCCEARVALGTDERAHFEDALEGLVNGIRLLREDGMARAALRAFDQALAWCTARDEALAGATFAAEAATFAQQVGLAGESTRYALLQATALRDLSRTRTVRGAPPAAIETALLQAVSPLTFLGQMARVGTLYAELAELDLPTERRARYARAAHLCEGAIDEPLAKVPDPRTDHEATEATAALGGAASRASWQSDLLEWEEGADAAEVCASVLLDRAWPDLVRRRALLARLLALDAAAAAGAGVPTFAGKAPRVQLAAALGGLQLYAALAPLEALFDQGAPEVRVAALRALGTLRFARSFVAVERGLSDPHPGVRDAATQALGELRFPQARARLTRLAHHAPFAAARARALEALSSLDQGPLEGSA